MLISQTASEIHKVAVFGASGNIGAPITAALLEAGFQVTAISHAQSTAKIPSATERIKIDYTTEALTKALNGQDAVISVVGPAGIRHQLEMIDAAEAAGVKRFIINDFGWGETTKGLPEFATVQLQRRSYWEYTRRKAMTNPSFTWTGITIGNPIDWAMKMFPTMGFDVKRCSATIYDKGLEQFTGTTLEGIGQSIVGVLQKPGETANRFVKVMSLKTCQQELLSAFEKLTGRAWDVTYATTQDLLISGRRKHGLGERGWTLDLAVAQLYDEGQGRCKVAESWDESDSVLLGVRSETPEKVVSRILWQSDMC